VGWGWPVPGPGSSAEPAHLLSAPDEAERSKSGFLLWEKGVQPCKKPKDRNVWLLYLCLGVLIGESKLALCIPPHIGTAVSEGEITPSSKWAEALALGWGSARRQRSGSRSEPLLQELPESSAAKQSRPALLCCWGSSFQGLSRTSASMGKSPRGLCTGRRGKGTVLDQSRAQPGACLLGAFLATARSALQSVSNSSGRQLGEPAASARVKINLT